MKNLFEGIRVVDFSTNAAGPTATAHLADFGADVIKIEKPLTGDDCRGFAPQLNGVGLPFCWINRGKKSIVLDLETPEAREIVIELVAGADLLVESFKPGTMEGFGLHYEALNAINPRIIYCSVSAFGQTGPESNKPGYDTIVQALCGAMDLTGQPDGPPNRLGYMAADYSAGLHAFGAIASALFHRERTGEGQHIDISLLDCMVSMNGAIDLAAYGINVTRSGDHSLYLPPFGMFKGKDEAVVICAPGKSPWTALCNAMGRQDMIENPMFSTTAARAKNIRELIDIIENWLKSFNDIEEAIRIMERTGVPCAKVNSCAEVLQNQQLKARNMFVELETPTGISPDRIKTRGNPLKFSTVRAIMKKPPLLGEHQDEVLKSIGYDEIRIATLKNRLNI